MSILLTGLFLYEMTLSGGDQGCILVTHGWGKSAVLVGKDMGWTGQLHGGLLGRTAGKLDDE